MHKSFRTLLIIGLVAGMALSGAATALAVQPDGSGTPSGPMGPLGPVTSSGSSSETPAPTPEPEPAPTPQQSVVEIPAAADVQQRISEASVTVRLLQPDMTWTDVIYAKSNGASVSAPAGFISMCIFHTSLPGDVMYRTYNSTTGWTRWAMNGEHTSREPAVLVEAIQLRLKGVINDYFDISYSATLNDGTTCGWSYNGQTNGTMGTGKYITGLQFYLTLKGSYDSSGTAGRVVSATSYDGIQFGSGLPTFVSGTGQAYTGWAWNGNDQYYFTNNTAVTGWQYIDGYKYYFDEGGKLVTDLEPIIGANGPYLIKVNKQMNCTTIYVQDGDNGYIIPLKSFLCSTGEDTPIGTFHSPEKYRWHEMIHGVYCQYLTRLGSGLHILLHSPVYNSASPFSLQTDTYNYMGVARSAGCIRFMVGDCKWIYDHCPLGTTIQVYNSSVCGPYERPCVPELASLSQTWDPTDVEAAAVVNAQAQQAALEAQAAAEVEQAALAEQQAAEQAEQQAEQQPAAPAEPASPEPVPEAPSTAPSGPIGPMAG